MMMMMMMMMVWPGPGTGDRPGHDDDDDGPGLNFQQDRMVPGGTIRPPVSLIPAGIQTP